ncbi:MAG: DUF433 domain-containing protein [Ktedonobacterales bacterium]
MRYHIYPHITANADILSGQPVIEGTQVPASMLVTQVAAGKSLEEVAREYGVTLEDVRAALEFAAKRAAKRVTLGGTGDAADSASDSLTPAGAEEAKRLGLDPATLSTLGRRLLDQRAKIRASGVPMLTWDQLDTEMSEQRGTGAE